MFLFCYNNWSADYEKHEGGLSILFTVGLRYNVLMRRSQSADGQGQVIKINILIIVDGMLVGEVICCLSAKY